MTSAFVLASVLAGLGAAALGLAAAAPERTRKQRFAERMASGAASLMMRGIAAGYTARGGTPSTETGPVLVHVAFRAEGDLDAFERRMDGFAPFLSNVPGLVWKVWALERSTRAASGTYLFASRAAADLYLAEILPEGMGNVPYIADMSISVTPVMVGPSRVTHARLAATMDDQILR